MARPDINRSGEIEVFVRVVEAESFSAAARDLRMTPSAVSKLIARLEDRLGARLIRRSTRKLQVTPEGLAFYESGLRILADLSAAEREASLGATPRGRLRINCLVPFGQHYLIPLIPRFLEQNPEITIELTLTDKVVDLMEERADLAIRAGQLTSPGLVARRLGQSRMVMVASPAYLEAHGLPQTPADLAQHKLLGFCFRRTSEGWPFLEAKGQNDGKIINVVPDGSLVSDGEQMRLMILAGGGIGRLSCWHSAPDIKAGRLVPLLEDFNPGDEEAVHAVYVGQGKHLPARVRAFLDFLVANVKMQQGWR
ncbi:MULTISPECIES: LysR family transcriptional regulator [unclassified Beijerinckia]|uniref:LysR family transcriptional regulator n=1 Tax=unclassified Beijerinckia TaxID=2638183 RepID=UPI000895EC29|nr:MULTISPECIES: LysR family transcriptional regulator [unclassified Beijerinckia]MDH7794991.1 DNA-binding transcriptional LysR family regulator [Beijerinckia sp. GAS462]SEB83197.1 DNA-binding transcriptional regulator, LysR family [Beijerinckia sp. 28-YEA-48]